MKTVMAAVMLCSGLAAAEPVISATTTTTTVVTIDTNPVVLPLAPPSLTEPSSPLPSHERAFKLSAAIGPGLGLDTKDKCGEGECGSVHVEVGGAISHQLLLLVGTTIMRPLGQHASAYPNATHHVETLALQYAITPKIWVEAGLGVGSKRSWVYDTGYTMKLSGLDPAGTVAAGFEVLAREGYSLGIQARVATTVDLDHTSFGQLLVGVSWY